MPILINEKDMLIKSDAFRQLEHEMRGYCNVEVGGKSFLIAGHRGSGKTTLVESVTRKLSFEWSNGDSPILCKPIPVHLLGPALLPNPQDGDMSVGKNTEFESVLLQIILGLYRALSHEFIAAYRDRMLRKTEWFARSGHDPRYCDDLELSALFEMELDEYLDKAQLREFWRRADALDTGLFYRPRARPASTDPYDNPSRYLISDQAYREIVALSSLCEAYRRISGTINRKESNKDEGSQQNKVSSESEAKRNDLFGPLLTLLAGGAAASGASALEAKGAVAVLAGIVTAMVSSLVIKSSASRSQQRDVVQEDLFMPDLSLATLDRVLPVLLERSLGAGLAPIFIIDELDKVEGLSERMPLMIKRLKKLVAENGFFCFLADRSYYEAMRGRAQRVPYSIEYTYFTNQLFISYRHHDLHEYLGRVLKKPALTQTSEQGVTAPTQEQINQVNEEICDHAVLPYVVLLASQLHPIDLHRELIKFRDQEGNVALSLGLVRSLPRYRLELLMQVAIELILDGTAMQWEIDREPGFRRLAHDTLYYIPREWEGDKEELTLDEEGKESFIRYLHERMGNETLSSPPATAGNEMANAANPKTQAGNGGAVRQQQSNGEAAATAAIKQDEPKPTSDDDEPEEPKGQAKKVGGEQASLASFTLKQADFLWDRVIELAQMLEKPEIIRQRSPNAGFAAEVIAALNFNDPGPLLTPKPGEGQVYQWNYSRSGRPLRSSVAVITEERQDDAGFILAFTKQLKQLTEGSLDPGMLSAGLGLLPTSPAWPTVEPTLS